MTRVRLNSKSLIVVALLALPATLAYFMSAEQIDLVVEEKSGREGRSGTYLNVGTSRHDRRDKFLIYSRGEVFEVSTSYVFMKFETAERFYSLKTGNSYRVVVAGWRIPMLGQYRNIIEVLPN